MYTKFILVQDCYLDLKASAGTFGGKRVAGRGGRRGDGEADYWRAEVWFGFMVVFFVLTGIFPTMWYNRSLPLSKPRTA